METNRGPLKAIGGICLKRARTATGEGPFVFVRETIGGGDGVIVVLSAVGRDAPPLENSLISAILIALKRVSPPAGAEIGI